jgi:hypothetical protein
MSAPYIIPFNHQPVTTGVSTSGTYTVPAGKYARVKLNCVLPTLNGTPLYINVSINNGQISAAATYAFGVSRNIHRISFSGTSGAVAVRVNVNATATANDYIATANMPGTLTLTRRLDANYISVNTSANPGTTGFSYDYMDPTMEELWLKAGDVIAFSSGNVFYEEYNEIS